MTVESHPVVSREQWLEWRQRDVTASACAALLDVHPYITKLQLWLEKSGPLLPNVDTPPMRRGRLLEPVALELIREMHPDWKVEPANVYLRDGARRIGATPDCYVHNENGFGIVEVKSVERGVFERSWRDGDGSISPPLSAALQSITCKRLAGADWCSVAALRVGHGIELDLIEVPEPEGLWPRLLDAVAAFWQSVESGVPPQPTFPADADLVLRLAGMNADETTVDLTGNNELPELAAEDASLAFTMKTLGERRKSIKAQVLHAMGPATVALINGRVFATANVVQRKAYTVAPSSYRDLRIKGVAS